MNQKKLLFAGLFSVLFLGAWAKEIPVVSKIDAVTVFTQGAQIFSTADVPLEKGEYHLVFTNLTTDFDPSTIRVGGKGALTILSVSSRTNYAEPPKQSEQIVALQSQIKTLDEEIENLNAMRSVYAEEEDLLLKNKQLGGTQAGVDVAQLKLAADYLRSRLAEIKTKRIEVDRNIRKKQEEAGNLRAQLNTLSGQRGKTTGEIVVKIAVDKTTKAHFELTYLVNNAGWTPYYDARMQGVDKPISLEYKAKVYQQTGVEWTNVDLTLSSGNPSRNGMLPALNPWYIDFAQNYGYNTRNSQAAPPQAAYDGGDQLMEVTIAGNATYQSTTYDDAEMKSVESVVVEHALNFEYVISVPYTIASSYNPEDVAIRTVEVPASYEYRANVKLDKTAYLVAKLSKWQDYNLLNGSAKLFNEGTFVGEVYLDIENTADTLLLSLGRDENIVISRERLVDMNGDQLAGSSKKETRYWKTTIRNTKKQAVRLVLTEQIPISRQKDITVKLEEAKGAVFTESTGYVVWNLNILSNTTQEVIVGYSVKYPKDKQLTFYD